MDSLITFSAGQRRTYNASDRCNRTWHPWKGTGERLPYRPYRRGKMRCHDCGARIGHVALATTIKSAIEELKDSLFASSPLMSYMRRASDSALMREVKLKQGNERCF